MKARKVSLIALSVICVLSLTACDGILTKEKKEQIWGTSGAEETSVETSAKVDETETESKVAKTTEAVTTEDATEALTTEAETTKDDTDAVETEVETEVTEAETEVTEVAVPTDGTLTADEIIKRVSEVTAGDPDMQFHMDMVMNMTLSMEGMEIPMDSVASTDVTKIGNVMHQVGTTSASGVEVPMEQWTLIDGDTVTSYVNTLGNWMSATEKYTPVTGDPSKMFDGATNVSDVVEDGSTYKFSATLSGEAVKSVMQGTAEVANLDDATVDAEYVIDKNTFYPVSIKTTMGSFETSGVKVNNMSITLTYTWPPSGPDAIPADVLNQ